MTKVVSIVDGTEIKPPGTPNPTLVEALERTLEKARSGEISGAFIFMVHSDETVSQDRSCKVNYRVIGATQTAVHELCAIQLKD